MRKRTGDDCQIVMTETNWGEDKKERGPRVQVGQKEEEIKL